MSDRNAAAIFGNVMLTLHRHRRSSPGLVNRLALEVYELCPQYDFCDVEAFDREILKDLGITSPEFSTQEGSKDDQNQATPLSDRGGS